MKTIVEALKDLYVALGGKEQDVANLLLNPDVIEKIAAVAGDAVKPELPSLTGNAGKFLKVDSDAEGVEWAEAGGGGGLTLYGPYLAVPASGVTVAVNDYKTISMTKIMNEATEDYVILPDDPFIAFLIGGFVQNGNMYLKGVNAPIYYDSTFTYDASVDVENHDINSQTIEEGNAGVRFFCSVELQPATA